MELMQGRRGLVVGIANERSLAYGIARACRREGAELAVTYQNERLLRRVQPLATELGAALLAPCDLTAPADLERLVKLLRDRFGALDFVVHAVAHARREELEGRLLDTSREGFVEAMEVSAYSLLALTRAVEPLLLAGQAPSVLTLTYYGSDKAFPNYNVMGLAKAALEAGVRYLAAELGPAGIRVNAISAGPVKTLSAAGVSGLRDILASVPRVAPLRRNVTIDDVGNAALFLLSELSAATTGEVIFADAGYHVVGPFPRAAEGHEP